MVSKKSLKNSRLSQTFALDSSQSLLRYRSLHFLGVEENQLSVRLTQSLNNTLPWTVLTRCHPWSQSQVSIRDGPSPVCSGRPLVGALVYVSIPASSCFSPRFFGCLRRQQQCPWWFSHEIKYHCLISRTAGTGHYENGGELDFLVSKACSLSLSCYQWKP